MNEISRILERLVRDSGSKAAFLLGEDGNLIDSFGETEEFEDTDFANWIAPYKGALKEKEFSVIFNEPDRDNVYISILDGGESLIVVFTHAHVGLIRLRIKKANDSLSSDADEDEGSEIIYH